MKAHNDMLNGYKPSLCKNAVLACCALLVAYFFCFLQGAIAETYYLSPDGNDRTGYGSYTNPWRTPAKARRSTGAIALGDTVIFKNGTYTRDITWFDADFTIGYTSDDSGSPDAKITYKAETKGGVTIDAAQGSNIWNLGNSSDESLNRGHYLIFDGFMFTGFLYSAITVRGLGVEIRNCSFSAHGGTVNRTTCVGISGSDFLVEDCDMTISDGTDVAHGIYVMGHGAGTIRNSSFHDCDGNGIQIQAGLADYHIGTIRIYGNKVYNNQTRHGIYVAAYSGGIIDAVYIYNNLVWNNGQGADAGIGFGITVRDANVGYVYNNTLYGNRYGINQNALSGTMQNNILVNTSTDVSDSTAQNANITKSNNLTTNGNEADSFGVTGKFDLSHFASIDSSSSSFLKLSSTASEAVDTGVTLPELSTDFFGHPRPQGTSYDIGACELEGTTRAPINPENPTNLRFSSVQ